jgi:N12 class adenine-specific DNA methylase
VFEMAVPIQSPAKCEVRSVIRLLDAKGERPAEIHKQTVAVYGDVMNRQNVTEWCREFSVARTDVHDEQKSDVFVCVGFADFVGTLEVTQI